MSARYSPIAPLPLLEQLHDRQLLGSYLLLLAHDVLEHPRGYIDLVDSIVDEDRFIIMDNGVIERGNALTAIEVIEAANLVDASCIMTPDVVGNFVATQKLVIEQASALRNSGFPLMKVPQGQTLPELIQCADWLRDYLETPNSDPDYWGVPRWITNELGTRASMVHYIGMRAEKPKIHLLGMSENLDDDLFCARMENTMGIDSANPLVMSYTGIVLPDYKHVKRGCYWDLIELWPQAIDNVKWMHGSVS